MSQNTSHAVMAQRHEPPDSLDFFPTPPWATRALCEWLGDRDEDLGRHDCLEPACGEGHMARVLAEYFSVVMASDCHQYGYGGVDDFLFLAGPVKPDWIITNPPFRLGVEFAEMALRRSYRGAALLVRTAFLEGEKRWQRLFRRTPPTEILQFTGRVVMLRGRLVSPDWINPETGSHFSTATSYCWLVWRNQGTGGLGQRRPEFHWIPPCRKALERPGDYACPGLRPGGDPPAAEAAPAPLLDGAP